LHSRPADGRTAIPPLILDGKEKKKLTGRGEEREKTNQIRGGNFLQKPDANPSVIKKDDIESPASLKKIGS